MKDELKEYPGWFIESLPSEGDRPATVYIWEGEKRYKQPVTDPKLDRAEKMAINMVRNTIRDRLTKKLERRKKAAEPDRGELDLFLKQVLKIAGDLYGRDCEGRPYIDAILWDTRTHRLPSYTPIPRDPDEEVEGEEVNDVTQVEAAYQSMDRAQLNLSYANSDFNTAYNRLRHAQYSDQRRQQAAVWRDRGFRRGVRLRDNLGDLWDVVSDPSSSYCSPLDAVVVKAYRLRSGEREYTELRLNGDLTFTFEPKQV